MVHKHDYRRNSSAVIGWTLFIVIVLIVAAAAWVFLGDGSFWWR